jgi:FlaG/FlaF family flagellin (archaellin)
MRSLLPGAPHFRRKARRRAVSDVIGTILLLALAVSLFATFYTFVTTFPPPPPQPSAQFASTIDFGNVTGHGVIITFLNIAYLAGPTLYNTSESRIYAASNTQPALYDTIYTVYAGLKSNTWSIGQTWSVNVTKYAMRLPDNITISIVVNGQLLYRDTIPGDTLHVPPQFVQVNTLPYDPTLGNGFLIVVQILDPFMTPASKLGVNLSSIPGFSGTPTKNATYSAVNGTWQLWVPDLASSIGTFFVFMSALDSQNLRNTVAEPISIYPAPPSIAPGQGPAVLATLTLTGQAIEGSQANLSARVTDTASTAGTISLAFYVNGVLLSTSNAPIGAASSTTLYPTWVPTAVGPTNLFVRASIGGVGQGNGSLNTTVFPSILLVESNNAFTGTEHYSSADEGAWMAAALTAAGFPFQVQQVSCTAGINATAYYESYSVVVFDFGSSSSSACSKILNTKIGTTADYDGVEISNLIKANKTSVWVLGSNAVGLTTGNAKCPAASQFMHRFGLNSATNCGLQVTLPSSSATFTPAPGLGLLGLGVPASYTANATVAGNATFIATDLASVVGGAATATTFLTVSSDAVGTVYNYAPAKGIRTALTTMDLSMLVQAYPAPMSVTWGTGSAGAEVVYNIMNYLTGITPVGASSANRLDVDFGVSEVVVKGVTHTLPSNIGGFVRSNGVNGGYVTVALYVNGTPAFFGGSVVATTLYLAPGSVTAIEFTWEAPGGGSYAISMQVFSVLDHDPLDSQFGTGLLFPRTVFT